MKILILILASVLSLSAFAYVNRTSGVNGYHKVSPDKTSFNNKVNTVNHNKVKTVNHVNDRYR